MALPKEYNWWMSHPEISLKYEGEYIAIIDEKVVAHSKNFKEALEAGRKTGKEPWIHKVHPFNKEMVI